MLALYTLIDQQVILNRPQCQEEMMPVNFCSGEMCLSADKFFKHIIYLPMRFIINHIIRPHPLHIKHPAGVPRDTLIRLIGCKHVTINYPLQVLITPD